MVIASANNQIISQNIERCIFDANDINYLARNLTLKQLFTEINPPIVSIFTSQDKELRVPIYPEYWGEPWRDDYIAAVKLAIDIIQSNQPKTKISHKRNKESLESLKARYDLVSYIGQYTRLRKSGPRYSGKCPLHSGQTLSSIVIYPNQTFHCFSCQAHGTIIDFVMAREHTDVKGAIATLGSGI